MEFFQSKKIAIGKYGLLPGSGVNLERYELLEYPQTDKYHFLFISRIMKEKGIDQYLEAAKKIKEKYKNTEFHICGFCEEEYEEILAKLQDEGMITYHGLINNVSEFLKNIHCVVHPTYYPEGLSNVLLEACASGRPIITTNRPGCREVVDAGKNGFVVEERNADDLSAKIEQFLLLPDEDKKNMGVSGRKKVEKEFNRQIVIEAYMKEIKG
jgi:galacturonosyltransferase